MRESGRCWMPLVPAPTGLPGPAAVSSASSSPGWSPWLLRYQTPRVPRPARYHERDRLPCPLRRSAATCAPGADRRQSLSVIGSRPSVPPDRCRLWTQAITTGTAELALAEHPVRRGVHLTGKTGCSLRWPRCARHLGYRPAHRSAFAGGLAGLRPAILGLGVRALNHTGMCLMPLIRLDRSLETWSAGARMALSQRQLGSERRAHGLLSAHD